MQPVLEQPKSATVAESGNAPTGEVVDAVRSKGPFAFRFVVKFGPQLSTPCSRSLEVGPQTLPIHGRRPSSLFQGHLRCQTFAR